MPKNHTSRLGECPSEEDETTKKLHAEEQDETEAGGGPEG